MDAPPSSTSRDVAYLSELVHRIYEAGTRPERWSVAVAAIAQSFGCTKGLLFTPYVAPQHGGFIFPCGIGEDSLQLWASSYIDHDIWSQQLMSRNLIRSGVALVDEQVVPQDELVASKFYQEFLSKIGIGRVCTGFVFGNEPGFMTTLFSVFRALDEPPFDAADVEWMKLLVSHVSRSMGVMQRLDTLRLEQTSLLTSFDRLAFGVVLLDDEMRVVYVNRLAQEVLDRRDGLAIGTSRQLESTTGPYRQLRLSQWLDTVREAPPTKRVHFLDGCLVPRKDSGSHYVVQCSALATHNEWSPAGRKFQYVAFITDPAALCLPDEERLSQLYGLTTTQARVALAFARGDSYKQAARSLGISEETVRSHVKEIYPKTRVNRQADLVRLVLSLGHSGI
jgi:DNA-binding CsgD family transcriptional regulator